jgi:hypothetical protein
MTFKINDIEVKMSDCAHNPVIKQWMKHRHQSDEMMREIEIEAIPDSDLDHLLDLLASNTFTVEYDNWKHHVVTANGLVSHAQGANRRVFKIAHCL